MHLRRAVGVVLSLWLASVAAVHGDVESSATCRSPGPWWRRALPPYRQPVCGTGATLQRLRGGATEHTFAMLKPDIASDAATVEEVKRLITEAGLTIEREKATQLSQEQCEAFYAEHKERPFFGGLVEFMSSGPVLMLELSGDGAIAGWRKLIGPTNSLKAREEAPGSVRALFGTDGQQNAAHGSDAPESAQRELEMMF